MANYFVSAGAGDNGDAGDEMNPWATLNHALGDTSPVAPGDTIHVRGGNYNERIIPKKSGASENPITIRAYEDETPNLRGQSGQENILVLSGVSHLTFGDGLYFSYAHATPRPDRRFPWIQILSSAANPTSNIILQNFEIERPGWEAYETIRDSPWREWGIMLDGANDCLISGLTIRGLTQGIQIKGECMRPTVRNCDIGYTRQSCITITSSGNVIRGAVIFQCLLHNSIIEDGVQFMQDFSADNPETDESNRGTVIAYCVLSGHAENAIDLKGARYVLIHGNVIHGNIGSNDGEVGGWNRNATGGITRGASTSSSHILIRHNIIYDSAGGTRLNQYWKTHNNTFVYNRRDYAGPGSTFDSGILFMCGARAQTSSPGMGSRNNIFSGHRHGDVSYRAGHNQPGNEMDTDFNLYASNLWRDTSPSTAGTVYTTLPAWQTRLAANNWRFGKDVNSIAVANHAAIQFENVPANPTAAHTSYNFGLKATSPAKNRGGHLTTTVGSASNSSWVTVNDVSWHSDIFNRTDILFRDQVLIGSTGAARRILEIDYGNNRFRVDEPVSYGAGVPVVYIAPGHPVTMTPDIGAGAFQSFDSEGPPPDPDEPGEPTPPPPDPPPPAAGTAGGRVVVQVACATTTGNQTISFPEGALSRAPAAFRFTVTRALTSGTPADHSYFARGWAMLDGETVVQGAAGIRSQHNTGTTSSGRRTIADGCIFITNGNNNTITGQASFVSGDQDECVINWTSAPPSAFLLTVEAFDADAAYLGVFEIATAVDDYVTVTTGIDGNYAEIVTVNGSIPNSQANNRWSHGLATRDEIGNITQQCFLYQAANSASTTAIGAHLRNEYVGGEPADGGAMSRAIQLSNWGATSFRVNTKVATFSSGIQAFVFVLKFDMGVYSGIVAMPDNADGDRRDYRHTVGFEPGQVDLLATGLVAVGSADNTGNAGTWTVGAWDGDTQVSNGVTDRDGVGTSVTKSVTREGKISHLNQHDGTAGIEAEVIGATATELAIDYEPALTVDKYAILVAVRAPETKSLVAIPTADPTEGVAPLTVQFTDASIANNTTITEWEWEWNFGIFSTEQNPEHTFELPGLYTILLSVGDGDISHVAALPVPITVNEPPDPPPPPPPPLTVKVLASADAPKIAVSDVIASAEVIE